MKKNSIAIAVITIVFLAAACKKHDTLTTTETLLRRGWRWGTDSTIETRETTVISTGLVTTNVNRTAPRSVVLGDSLIITNDRVYNKRTSVYSGSGIDTSSYVLTTISGAESLVRTNLRGTKDTLEIKSLSADKLVLRKTYPTAVNTFSIYQTIIVNKYDEWVLY